MILTVSDARAENTDGGISPMRLLAFADDKHLRADQGREILSEYSVSIDQCGLHVEFVTRLHTDLVLCALL